MLLALVLGIVMGRRAYNAKKFMPAGLVAAVSGIAFILNAKRALELKA